MPTMHYGPKYVSAQTCLQNTIYLVRRWQRDHGTTTKTTVAWSPAQDGIDKQLLGTATPCSSVTRALMADWPLRSATGAPTSKAPVMAQCEMSKRPTGLRVPAHEMLAYTSMAGLSGQVRRFDRPLDVEVAVDN